MISKIIFNNFRCFKYHEIEFKELNVIIGKNNSGKSTVVEALRLLSLVLERYKNINYKSAPDWTGATYRGISPKLQGYNFTFVNVCYQYSDPPAIIKFLFTDNSTVEIFVNNNSEVFAILKNKTGRNISSKSGAENFRFQTVKTLPQLGPLLKEETKLESDYVLRNLSSSLSSLHFRNQLLLFDKLFKNYFENFQFMADKTWPGLQIQKLDYQWSELENYRSKSNQIINLFIRDGIFEAEVGWVGQGLQMWLQMIWFLTQCDETDVIILDEPDVYLHPDLQRKLIDLVKNNYKQIILTTHSIEIISEIEPSNILIVDKTKSSSKFATKYSRVQTVLDNMGSVHNISIAKLFFTKKFVVLEGKDLTILKKIYKKLFPNSIEPISSLPYMECGGWGGWSLAVGSYMGFNYSTDANMIVYCLLDSDYKTENQIQERIQLAKEKDIQLHIWNKKEIENYLLISSLIKRLIEKNATKNLRSLTIEKIEVSMNEICDSFKEELTDNFSDEIFKENRALGVKFANNKAREIVNKNWNTLNEKCSIIPGKSFISKFSNWSKTMFGVSLNANQLASEINIDEVNEEIKYFLTKIENSEKIFKPDK